MSVLMEGVAVSLMTGCTLSELNLSNNSFGNKGESADANCLLLWLSGGRCAGMEHVASALAAEVPIARLVLADNKLGDAAGVALGEVLAKNKSTRQLVLSRNSIGKKGWQAIAEGLNDNRALESLELAHCELDRIALVISGCFG